MFEGLQLTFKRIIPNGFMLFLIIPLKAFNEPPCTNMFVHSTRRECRIVTDSVPKMGLKLGDVTVTIPNRVGKNKLS